MLAASDIPNLRIAFLVIPIAPELVMHWSWAHVVEKRAELQPAIERLGLAVTVLNGPADAVCHRQQIQDHSDGTVRSAHGDDRGLTITRSH